MASGLVVAALTTTLAWHACQPLRADELSSPLADFERAVSGARAESLWTVPASERLDLVWPAAEEISSTERGMAEAAALGESPRDCAVLASPRFRVPPEPWCWQILPDGLIYRSYLAGAKEPRFASAWVHEQTLGWIWDVALGGRAGLVRYGTQDSLWPEGWQLDIEGAALPRLLQNHGWIVMATDFRFGIPLTYGRGRYRAKFGYYHLCSHLGDEYLLVRPSVRRLNYVRDAFLWGNSYYWTNDLRLYAEAAWAFSTDDGAEPWEFQFGVDYSPDRPGKVSGTPFLAVNTHLRQEVAFGGNLVVQTGWQWRGGDSGHLFRMGMQYFAGMSEQFEFYDAYEEKLGMAVWYDF